MQKLEKSCTDPHGNSHDDTLTHTCKQKYKKIEILGSIDNFIMSHDFVTHGIYHISGAMVKLFASNAGICGFSAQHAATCKPFDCCLSELAL